MAVTQKVSENHSDYKKKPTSKVSKPTIGSRGDLSVEDRLVTHYSLPSDTLFMDGQASWSDDNQIQTAQRHSVAQKIGHDLGNIQLQRMAGSEKRKKDETEPEVGLQEREEPLGEETPKIQKPDLEEPIAGKTPVPESGAEPIKEEAPIDNEPQVKLKTEETGEERLENTPDKALEAQPAPGALSSPSEKAPESEAPGTPLESPAEKGESTNTVKELEKESPAAGIAGPDAGSQKKPATEFGGPTVPPAAENARISAPVTAGAGSPLQALADQVNTQRENIEGAVRQGQTQLILDGMSQKATLAGNILGRKSEVEGLFKTKTTGLETLRVDQKRKIETERLAQRQAVQKGYEAKLAELIQVYNKRFVEMRKAGDVKASGVAHYANRRSAWLSTTTLTNVQRGHQIGENRAAAYIEKKEQQAGELGKMARKVAARWSTHISGSGGEINTAILKEGNDKATEIRAMALKAGSKFAEGTAEASKALIAVRDKAFEKIDEGAKAALVQVDPIIARGLAALLTLKTTILANLDRMETGFQTTTDLAVTKGMSVLANAGQARINNLEQGYMEVSGAAASQAGGGEKLSPEARAALNASFMSEGTAYSSGINAGVTKLRGMLSGGYLLVTSRLATFVGRIEGSVSRMIAETGTGLNNMVQQSGMGKVTENALTTMATIVSKLDVSLGEATTKSGAELDKAVAISQQSLNQKALDAQKFQEKHLDELGTQIDAKADELKRSRIVRAFLAVGRFLEAVGSVFWKMIKGLVQLVAILAVAALAMFAIVAAIFAILAVFVGSAVAGLVALVVALVLAATIAVVAIGMMVKSLWETGNKIGQDLAVAYTDDTLTDQQRATHAGEAVGEIAVNVVPAIPGAPKAIGARLGGKIAGLYKRIGSPGAKLGARISAKVGPALMRAGEFIKVKGSAVTKRIEAGIERSKAASAIGKGVTKGYEKVKSVLGKEVWPKEKPPVAEAAPELAKTLPPGEAPTLKPGEVPAVRRASEAELAKTQPAAEAPTLRPGEEPAVRGPGERRPIEGGGGGPPRGTTRHGMGPPGPPLPPGPVPPPPKLVRRFENDDAALAEALTHARQGKAYNIASPNSLREQWGILGEAGKPPPAWIDSNESLWIDGERVLGWGGGTKPPILLPSGPEPIYTRKTVPYAESPILNRPGANVPAELVKTLPPEAMPPGGGTRLGLGPGPTLPPEAMPTGRSTAPYQKISLGEEPISEIPISGGRTPPPSAGPPAPPLSIPKLPTVPVWIHFDDAAQAARFGDRWAVELGRKVYIFVNKDAYQSYWNLEMGQKGVAPVAYIPKSGPHMNELIIDDSRLKVPLDWVHHERPVGRIRPGGGRPPGETPTLPPGPGPSGAGGPAGEPLGELPGTKTITDTNPPTHPINEPGLPEGGSRMKVVQAPESGGRPIKPVSTSEVTQILTRPPGRETPLTVSGLIKWFEQLFGRKSKLTLDDLHILERDKFKDAYRRITNKEGVKSYPEAFTDPRNGQIYVDASFGDVAKLHELIHQFAVRAKTREAFIAHFGRFLEEAITEGILRQRLGIKVKGGAYEYHMDFFKNLTEAGIEVGVLERAYLDGNYRGLVDALVTRFNGDKEKANTFIQLLIQIGEKRENSAAYGKAILMIEKGDYVNLKLE